jgi:molybdopterin-biosynthesis enzyme MoeA-like protein
LKLTVQKIGLIVVGDEILSGRRVDKHLPKLVELLGVRGMQLSWAEYIGDDPQRLVDTLKRSFASKDIVFSTGGIGATPDDHTRACTAKALGLELALHPEAKDLISQRIIETAEGDPIKADLTSPGSLQRFRMGEFPIGSQTIPNTYNLIPGYSIQEHYFLPGFPVMAERMMAWVLDTYYPHMFHQNDYIEKSFLVGGSVEATITPLMEEIERLYPKIKVFSLPSLGDPSRGGLYAQRHIELGVKGPVELVDVSLQELRAGVTALQLPTYDLP